MSIFLWHDLRQSWRGARGTGCQPWVQVVKQPRVRMCRILKKQDSYSCLRPRTQILTQDETFKGFGFGHACYGLMLSYSPTYVLHLVLPNLKLSFLDADIFIKVHSSLTMFSLNMIDYPMSFISPKGYYCQPQSPWTNWVFQLIRTWLWLGLGGLRTKGLGPGLDNNGWKHLMKSQSMLRINVIHLFLKTWI